LDLAKWLIEVLLPVPSPPPPLPPRPPTPYPIFFSLIYLIFQEFPELCIGFTGVVTFKSAKDLHQVVKYVPLSRILLETDGPFMAPVPHRGADCHSGFIPFIAQEIAKLKGVTVDEVYAAARANTKRIYGV